MVSGLDLGSSSDDLLKIQMMVDLVTGQLGDEGQQESSSKVVQVIVAGNLLNSKTQDKETLTKVPNFIKYSITVLIWFQLIVTLSFIF